MLELKGGAEDNTADRQGIRYRKRYVFNGLDGHFNGILKCLYRKRLKPSIKK